jgi:predicted dehydrogenase
MNSLLSRRRFIQKNLVATLAVGAFPSLLPASALGKDGRTAPSNRIAVGCIGTGPQGRGDLGGFLGQKDCQVIALCDVAKRNLDLARKQVSEKYQNSDCVTHQDFRELLARKDIDAVLIATPDHWHVPIALAAARAGKDIYLEKPMGLSVAEDQLLRRAVRENKRVFQFGTQQRSSREFRRAIELVRNGRIGDLKQINVWCSGSRPGGSTTEVPVPEGLDYERWLGPAPLSPYTVDKCFDDAAPGLWKTWWHNYDYALGFIAGWGVHPLDIAYWGHPTMRNGPFEIEGKAVIPSAGACNTAVAWEVKFAFADGVRLNYKATRNGCDPCSLNDISLWQKKYGKTADHGTAFEGTEGWVMVHRGALLAEPEILLEESSPGASFVLPPAQSNHLADFLNAVKTRTNAICPIEEAVQADILCHLSDIAVRCNRQLKWDPAKERFLKDDDANRRLALRTMREPWRLS